MRFFIPPSKRKEPSPLRDIELKAYHFADTYPDSFITEPPLLVSSPSAPRSGTSATRPTNSELASDLDQGKITLIGE